VSRCRFRYEDLPAHLKAQVDALSAGWKSGVSSQNPEVGSPQPEAGAGRPAGARRRCPNKTEAAYRTEVIGPRSDVAAVYYEGLTIRMANGHRYTPDWVVITTGGRIECHEVKGGYALHSHQRARLAFDQARVEFPWIFWVWSVKTKDGWTKGGC
jgi:hypothetical protein